MSEEKFLKEKDLLLKSIENNTQEHWFNYYKDVPIQCIFDDLVIDINEIKRLTDENKQLKEDIKELFKENENKEKVIIAQDNIIKEARKYINKRMVHEGEYYFRKAKHFRNTEFGKELLQILGDEKNE